MKLMQLRYFCAACRHNNITRAAEELYVSQPSVSSAIKDLEAEFGITIFNRLNKGFTLTKEGKILYDYAQKLLDQANNMIQVMSDLGDKRNYIRIGIPPMIGTFVFPKIYKGFIKQNPGVRILTQEQLGSRKLIESLENDLLDAVIVSGNEFSSNNFNTLKIAETETVFCVASSHQFASKKSIAIAEIGDEPLIMFKSGFYHYELINNLFADNSLTPNVIHYSSQLQTMKEFISSGICSGFLFIDVIKSSPDIVGIPIERPIYIDISLVWKQNQYMYQDLLKFISYAKESSS